MVLSCLDDLSATTSAMQTTVDPYPSSAASLATSAEGELHRLRYIANKTAGWEGGDWYEHTTRAQIPNANFTANGDLEAWSAGTAVAPDSWTLTGTNAKTARNGTNFKHGTYAADVVRVGNDAYLSQVVSTLKPPAAWWRSKTVTLAAWVRATVASRARLVINDGVGTSASSYHTGGSAFEHLTVTRTLDAAASTVELRLQVDTGDTTAQFDAVTFTFGSYTTDFFASGIASGTGNATQTFRGLTVRTHPDSDVAASKVMLVHADEIVMDDGARVSTWDRLVADITVAGANGLDTGSEAASTWYEVYAIRKSSDGTKGALLHRAKNFFTDANQQFTTADDAVRLLRIATGTATDKIAQGFQSTTASSQGAIDFVDIKLIRAGAVSGNIWFTVETDTAGDPSGTVQATSDKVDAAKLSTTATWVRVAFRNPFTPTISTQYHLVLQGDYTRSDTVNIGWRGVVAGGYGSGSSREYNGATWAATAGANGLDRNFKVYTLNDTSVTMPTGYDQKALVGYVHNNGSSNFKPFVQRDRRVTVSGDDTHWNIGSTTAAISTLTDVAAFFPPVPVDAWVEGTSATAGTLTSIGPYWAYDMLADNLAPTQWRRSRGSPSNWAGPHFGFSEIPIDYQGMTVVTSSSTANFWVGGFTW